MSQLRQSPLTLQLRVLDVGLDGQDEGLFEQDWPELHTLGLTAYETTAAGLKRLAGSELPALRSLQIHRGPAGELDFLESAPWAPQLRTLLLGGPHDASPLDLPSAMTNRLMVRASRVGKGRLRPPLSMLEPRGDSKNDQAIPTGQPEE